MNPTYRASIIWMAGLMLACASPLATLAALLRVYPDGSGAHPCVQHAIDAATTGDQILLADGIYRGDGNRDLDFGGRAITVRSESGQPSQCILDLEGTEGSPHRGFYFHTGEGSASRIIGVTISGGYAAYGGAILVEGASPSLHTCVITGNRALFGGGVARVEGLPEFLKVTISDNRAGHGGGVYSAGLGGYMPALTHSILWGNCADAGDEIYLDNGALALYCCCFDLSGLDGAGVIGHDNMGFADDPQFCHPAGCEAAPSVGGDYTIAAESPCVPANNACNAWIGALGVGCSMPSAVEVLTWGHVKSRYLVRRTTRSLPSSMGAIVFVQH